MAAPRVLVTTSVISSIIVVLCAGWETAASLSAHFQLEFQVLTVGMLWVTSIAAAVLLWWRNRLPLAANLLVAMLALFPSIWIVPGANLVALLIACYAAARYNAERAKAAGVLAVAALAPITCVAFSWMPWPAAVIAILIFVVAALLGLWRRVVVVSAERSRDFERQLIVADAADQERSRIAADLHDSVAHSLAVVTAQAQGASRIALDDPKAAQAALEAIAEASRQAQRDIRVTLGLLDNEQHSAVGGISAVIARVQSTGLVVTHEGTEIVEVLDPQSKLLAYRMVQETLTNALKYAGPGSTVAIDVRRDGDRVVLRVVSSRSSSPDFPAQPSGSGRGLQSLQQRAEAMGGKLTVKHSAEAFQSEMWLPVRRSV